MKNTIKYTLLTLVIITILAFTGCAEFNIDAKITADNFVSYTYTLNFTELDEEDPNYSQLELFLLDIKEHWEQNGVEGRIETTDTTIKLTGTMEQQCTSREEAFNTLYSFMTNEISVYDSVKLDYTETDYRADYNYELMIDLTGVVDEQIYEKHPTIVDEDVDKFMENFKCSSTFTLPYNDKPQSMEITEQITETAISLDAPIIYNVHGMVVDSAAKQHDENLLAQKSKLSRNIIIFSTIAIIAFLGIVAIVIVGSKSKKKAKVDENIVSDDKVPDEGEQKSEE